jgi:hypothetical protein
MRPTLKAPTSIIADQILKFGQNLLASKHVFETKYSGTPETPVRNLTGSDHADQEIRRSGFFCYGDRVFKFLS